MIKTTNSGELDVFGDNNISIVTEDVIKTKYKRRATNNEK